MAEIPELEAAVKNLKRPPVASAVASPFLNLLAPLMGGWYAIRDFISTDEESAAVDRFLQIKKQEAILKSDTATPAEKEAASSFLNLERERANKDPEAFSRDYNTVQKILSKSNPEYVEEATKKKETASIIEEVFGPSAVTETKKALTPAAPATPTAKKPAEDKPPVSPESGPVAPTPKDVKDLKKEIDEEIKEPRQRMREIELEREEMELAEEKAARKAARQQRAYDAMTPAQQLALSVRAREQQNLANARSAVQGRREQMAADELGKAEQIKTQGYFTEGDVTQYVDPFERDAAAAYFSNRAKDVTEGTSTAGARPTFKSPESLTVVSIDPRYRATGDRLGVGIGHSPSFGGENAKYFGPDKEQMLYQTIGKKQVPIMTGEQAMATQSRGTGINQYEKTGTVNEQLDARSARAIRLQMQNRAIDEKLRYALSGAVPPRAKEEEERKKKAARPTPT